MHGHLYLTPRPSTRRALHSRLSPLRGGALLEHVRRLTMYLTASRSLKIAYAIVVLAAVVPIGLASSGWVALATGRGGAAIPYIGPILFLGLGIYRVVTVYRNPQALHSYPVKGFVNVLRKIGVFALYFGALVGVLFLVSWSFLVVLFFFCCVFGFVF